MHWMFNCIQRKKPPGYRRINYSGKVSRENKQTGGFYEHKILDAPSNTARYADAWQLSNHRWRIFDPRSDAAKIDRDVSSALTKLLEENQGARALAQKARGILVFPNMVIVNVGAAGALTTTTGQADIYAFFFNQKGLMGGISLQGSKISRINP